MFFKMNSNKMFFYYILFFSTLIAISSNSWLGCWIGLEINLLSFIPLISQWNNLLSAETSLKYFLVQSIASMNFLFFLLMNMISFKLFSMNNLMSIMINSSLFMKMGAAPFHFWFPNIMEGLSWMNCFILMTWQKITPMILLSYYYNMKFLFIISILTVMISAINGLNQTSLRKILAFSSINHLGWMIIAIMISNNLWNFYFIIYLFMMILICSTFHLLNFFFINQMFFNKMNNMIKLSIFLNFLSLGGMPPLLGFLPKWIIINFLIQNNMFSITFIFIMSALIVLFFYTRIAISSFLFNYMKLKWINFYFKNNLINSTNLMSFLSLMGLIFSTLLFFFI
uniref:NADH-ubiquinone oxidoreductase chain 2 n=1 Tax=Unilepidotricha sp. 1 SJR-2024a TaxID=3158271 RepID=A0AAU7E466_9NEOP